MAHRDDDHDDLDAGLEVAAAEAKLGELDEMLGDGVLTRASYLRARKAPERKLDDARRRLARHRHARPRTAGAGKRPAALYKKLDTDERRAVIGALLDHDVIHPAQRGRPTFDDDRIEPVWKARRCKNL